MIKKLKTIFKTLKKEAEEKQDVWTKEFLAEMSVRATELKNGKSKWQSVEQCVKKIKDLACRKKIRL